jgi:hypothetical protein
MCRHADAGGTGTQEAGRHTDRQAGRHSGGQAGRVRVRVSSTHTSTTPSRSRTPGTALEPLHDASAFTVFSSGFLVLQEMHRGTSAFLTS